VMGLPWAATAEGRDCGQTMRCVCCIGRERGEAVRCARAGVSHKHSSHSLKGVSVTRGGVGCGPRAGAGEMTKHRGDVDIIQAQAGQASTPPRSCVFTSHPTFYCRLWPWACMRHALEICKESQGGTFAAFFLCLAMSTRTVWGRGEGETHSLHKTTREIPSHGHGRKGFGVVN